MRSINLLSTSLHRTFGKQLRTFSTANKFHDNDVVIVSTARTPIGALQGSISSLSAIQLSSHTIQHALKRGSIDVNDVNEVILGNVVSSNLGQAPSTQASMAAGIPTKVPTTSVNKVCSSGMKSIIFGAQSIQLQQNHVVVTGGFESMSNTPYYLPKVRTGLHLGDSAVIDGIIRDGLWDPHNNIHMGNCAEKCARDYNISREQQDEYALQSYERAQQATKHGYFKTEIAPVTIQTKKGSTVIDTDDEPAKLLKDKVATLKPAFDRKSGTVTAANASKLNDGAATVILTSGAYARQHNITPLAVIRGYADAQQAPIDFTTAPALAIPLALKRANINASDIDLYEINEAFSVVALANQHLLKLNPNQLNVWGGAVALGHPIGASGARIVVTLLSQLQQLDKRYGVAGICNGGGGASAVVIERLVQ